MPQLENAANLRRQYHDIDMIISCGDMPVSYLEFITTIISVPLFYVRGNHDERYLENPPGGIDLHRKVVTYRGLTLSGLEGSIRYNRGKIQYTQSEMGYMVTRMGPKLAFNRLRHGRPLDIFVTHSPARNIHDGEDYPHRGFDGFLRFMTWYRPRYMLHGHVHTWDRRKTIKTQYKDTTIININPFTVLEIDPMS
jgi:Icc-related predicted phosphoesterase